MIFHLLGFFPRMFALQVSAQAMSTTARPVPSDSMIDLATYIAVNLGGNGGQRGRRHNGRGWHIKGVSFFFTSSFSKTSREPATSSDLDKGFLSSYFFLFYDLKQTSDFWTSEQLRF